MIEDREVSEAAFHREELRKLSEEKARLRNLTEVEALMLPPEDRITLIHKTTSGNARDIMEHGFIVKGAGLFDGSVIFQRASTLVRPGHEVSAEWSEEEVQDYNLTKLASPHRGAESVVIISLPDLRDEVEPAQVGSTLQEDGMLRSQLRYPLIAEHLEELFGKDEMAADWVIPPEMVVGVIHRDQETYEENPQFTGELPKPSSSSKG